MEFRCRLASAGGDISEGVYVAESEARLRLELEEKGLYILSLQPRRGLLAGVSFGPRRRRKIPGQEFLVFNQELATLLKAGMPLVQSLDILRQRLSNPVFKAVLDDVHEKVRAGTALSDAFAVHGDLFPSIYTASLMAGERSGNLDSVLRRYVAYEKIIGTVKKKTISALVYPAILVTLALILVSVIVLRVVPAFSEFYSSFGAELPLSTRVIIAVSNTLLHRFWLVLLVVVGLVVLFRVWVRQPGQDVRFDRFVLTVPLIGETLRKFATSQLARTVATLLGGGIPLLNALEIAGRSIGNHHLAGKLAAVTARVREGDSFAASLLKAGAFPDVAVKMVEVGESTGALQEMLNSLADFYDEEIETEVSRFITLVEPVLLVVMGIVIAALVLALYMPLFQLSSVIGT